MTFTKCHIAKILETRRENKKMPRTIMRIKYGCSREEATKRASEIMISNGYEEAEQNDKPIWVKGNLTGDRGIQIEYGENEVKLSGWIKGRAGEEIALQGVVGLATKHSVKKIMEELMIAISNG